MEILFIRHGQQESNGFNGQFGTQGIRGSSLNDAPLTPVGRVQIDAIASDYRLENAEIILSSDYPRAIQSAERLHLKLNKPHYIERDLHEWLPNKDIHAVMQPQELQGIYEEFRHYTGFPPNGDSSGNIGPSLTPPAANQRTWESLDEVRERVIPALLRYQQYKSIIVVSHAVVMASILGIKRYINHAEIIPYMIEDPANFRLESFQALEEKQAQKVAAVPKTSSASNIMVKELSGADSASESYSLDEILAEFDN